MKKSFKILLLINLLFVLLIGTAYAENTNTKKTEEVKVNEETQSEEVKTIAEKEEKATVAQIIEDGEYQIQSGIGNYFLSVSNDDNVVINQSTTAKNQKFYVKYVGDGYYEIYAMHSKKYIDVYGSGKKNGTNVLQYKKTNGDNQKWLIKDAKNGYFNIISKHSGLYLDIYGGIAKNGTNVLTWQKTDNKNQKFKFIKLDRENGTQTIANGNYKIVSALSSNRYIDISNNSVARIYEDTNARNQRFNVKYLGDGYYQITALHTGKALSVKSSSQELEASVIEYTANNADNQKWIIKDAGKGYYNIISKCNDLYLDIYGSSKANGTNIIMWKKTDGVNQKFKFISSEDEKAEKTIESGIYKIKSKLSNNISLDITAASMENSANLETWTNLSVQHQKFMVTYLNNGYYSIKAIHSGKYLDVEGSGTMPGTNVLQYKNTGKDNQKWIIKDAGDGYYNIISKHNNLYLDISGSSKNNGANVLVWKKTNNDNQKFKFEKVTQIQENGEFELVTLMTPDKVIDIEGASKANNANAILFDIHNGANQCFVLKYEKDGEYIIYNKNSNKLLTVNKENDNVYQYDNNNSVNQKWILEYTDNGAFYITSKLNGKCLDVTAKSTNNGTNIAVDFKNGGNNQKFIFRKFGTYYKEKKEEKVIVDHSIGTYGKSGALIHGVSGGSELQYYKVGSGPNVFFATFCVHGFEDSYPRDATEMAVTGINFYNKLVQDNDRSILDKWTIYIFPEVNPDGRRLGYTNNGPGRTTLYSEIGHGIDINRSWQTGSSYTRYTDSRNYNGTAAFQAYEAKALRDFLLSHKSTKGKTILVDLHGWENQLIGDSQIANYYKAQYPSCDDRNYGSYGTQYLISWARQNLGAKVTLVELPQVYNAEQYAAARLGEKYINATLQMLKGV